MITLKNKVWIYSRTLTNSNGNAN